MSRRFTGLYIVNSLVILIGCVFVLYLGVQAIMSMENFAIMGGGALFSCVAVILGYAQYRSAFRRGDSAGLVAAIFFFMIGAFSLFAIVTTTVECLQKEPESDLAFLVQFDLVAAGILAYAVFCGVLNWKWSRQIGTSANSNKGA